MNSDKEETQAKLSINMQTNIKLNIEQIIFSQDRSSENTYAMDTEFNF